MNVRSTSTDNQRLRLDQDSALVTSTNTFDVGITATTIGVGGAGSNNASITDDCLGLIEKDQYSKFWFLYEWNCWWNKTVSSPLVPMNFKPRILYKKNRLVLG